MSNRVPLRILHHLPENLASLGVQRQGDGTEADLITIAKTRKPVLKNFVKLCDRIDFLTAFGGGTWKEQGEHIPGWIGSGFRDQLINNNKESRHLYADALDPFIGGLREQLIVGANALDLYSRVGIYPANTFVHLDQAEEDWIQHWNKRHYWVIDRDRHTRASFDLWSDLYNHCKEHYSDGL